MQRTRRHQPRVVHHHVNFPLLLRDNLEYLSDAIIAIHIERKPLDLCAGRELADRLRATRRCVHGAALPRELVATAYVLTSEYPAAG